MKKTVTAAAISSVPLPSADLIQYRFDQLDETMKSFDAKLEKLITGGITKADVMEMSVKNDKRVTNIELRVDAHQTDIDQVKGAITALKIVSAILSGIALILGALWWIPDLIKALH